MVFTGSCQWQGAKTPGFHGICRVLSVASDQNPWFSLHLQGLVSGKWPKPMIFMVFAGSCQWQVAKNHGFHGICRVLSVASGHNPWLSWYLQGLVTGKWPKPTGFHGICGVLPVASGPSRPGKGRLAPGPDCKFSILIYIYIYIYI